MSTTSRCGSFVSKSAGRLVLLACLVLVRSHRDKIGVMLTSFYCLLKESYITSCFFLLFFDYRPDGYDGRRIKHRRRSRRIKLAGADFKCPKAHETGPPCACRKTTLAVVLPFQYRNKGGCPCFAFRSSLVAASFFAVIPVSKNVFCDCKIVSVIAAAKALVHLL